jgi:alpha-glucosidase
MSIHEAALLDWAGFTLVMRHNPKTLRAELTPWSDGVAVKAALPFKSSWRTLQVSDSATGLLNSHLILNLNEPNKLGDVSWVRPGKYTGVWWEMHRKEYTWGSGPTHGATNDRVKARIDFAADYGLDGVLVEGWNIGWDGNWIDNEGVDFSFTETYPDFDMPMLAAYGAERGVKIIGHHETSGNVARYEENLEAALDYYASHDVEQIKTGYVAWAKGLRRVDEQGFSRYEWHDGQWSANHHLRVVKAAARRQIAINAHEPIKDTGLRRTYPNWISREGARGMEYSSVGAGDGVNPPDHDVTLVFTRMLSGPMDYTPGIFDLTYRDLDTPARVKSTLAHQLALYVVIYSPIQMVPDYRRFYEEYPDALQFIRDVPTDWEQSIALLGELGDHVAFARQQRNSSDWYVGAITGNDARDLDIKLDFLDADARYTAQIYRDGAKAHWRDAPYDYVVEEKTLTAADSLSVRVAAGGGLAVRFIKQ